MFKIPDLPSVDFTKFELPKFEMPKFELPKFDLPTFDISAWRKADLSKVLPEVDEKLTAALRDAAYITVGLGVVAIERAQASRRQLIAGISERFGASKTQIDTLLSAVEAGFAKLDEQVDAVEARVDLIAEKIEGLLPEQAGALLGQARDAAKSARKQVRERIRPAV